jgi:hypothetical protein
MPATKHGSSGADFGNQEEVGMIAQTVTRTAQANLSPLADADGDVVDCATSGHNAPFSISGTRTGNTSLGATEAGGTLTSANLSAMPASGVAAGKKIVQSVASTGNAEGWHAYQISGTEYPSMAA